MKKQLANLQKKILATSLVLASFFTIALPLTSFAQSTGTTVCCLCTKSGASNVCFTPPPAGPGVASDSASLCGSYNTSPLFVGATLQAALAGYACTPGTSDQCAQHSATQASGMCPSDTIPDIGNAAPAPAATATPSSPATTPAAAATPDPPPFQSITPQVSVSVPGLHFGQAQVQDANISVPFLSDYIKAWYRFLIPVSFLVAVIMIVVGGFYYLIGATGGDTKKGMEYIRNAVLGVVLVMGAYTILQTINPETLNLDALQLPYIANVPLSNGELENANDGDVGFSPPPDACSTPGTLAAGESVIRLPRAIQYTQYSGPWAHEAYGRVPYLGFDQSDSGFAPTCHGGSEAGCWTTFQASACGVTSLAVVLAYYNAQFEGHLVTPRDTGRYAVLIGARTRSANSNNGTSEHIWDQNNLSQYFPGFTHRTVRASQAITEIRAGHPLMFGDPAACAVRKLRDANGNPILDAHNRPTADRSGCLSAACGMRDHHGQPICGGGVGHYMVVIGVSNDNSTFYIHDVGGEVWSMPATLVNSFSEVYPASGGGTAPTASHSGGSSTLCNGSG